MCGLAGWLGVIADPAPVATKMLATMRHRGPDGCGMKSWDDAVLLHTRLSIIDLSDAGAQPMCNEDGTVWVICNGEIYNHHELRRQLEAAGHVFRGHSDSEVIPHLFEQYGPAFVDLLRGMFAVAVYDRAHQRLFLVRDRFGIKPLFYAETAEQFVFASELNTLRLFPEIDTRPNRQAIYDFAALFYIPAPETFYAGIRAVEPGEIIEARRDTSRIRVTRRFYNKWVLAPDSRLDFGSACDRTDRLLTRAVKRQVESDVPIGALLSGGIDSSLVSVAAQNAVTDTIQTFNVRFPDESYDETWAALSVANHIQSKHQTLDFQNVEGTWDYVTDLLAHAGQPFADTSLFAVNSLCRLIREHVTVVLSGDGGDEGFGGYSHYWEAARIARLQLFPQPLWHLGAAAIAPLAHIGIVPHHFSLQLTDLAGADETAIAQNLFCLLRKDDHRALCPQEGLLPVRRLFEPQWDYQLPAGASRLDQLSARITEIMTRLSLPNDFLFKVDMASMREGLEIRVPMLDEDLFTYALSLPHSLKVKKQTGKVVLREVARRKLPQAVALKPKMGFSVPVDKWLPPSFREQLSEFLLGPASRLSEFFNPKAYVPIVRSFCGGERNPRLTRRESYGRVMMLLSVQLALANPS